MANMENKENFNLNLVKQEPGTEDGQPRIAVPAVPDHANLQVQATTSFAPRRVTANYFKENLGKVVTMIGDVLDIDASKKLLKIQLTDEHVIMASAKLPMLDVEKHDCVQIQGILEKLNKLSIISLHKFARLLFIDQDLLDKGGPELNKFDKSLYNEMVDLYHAHPEFMDVTNKMAHFGTEDIADEANIPFIDFGSPGQEEEDPTLGFVNHGIDSKAVEEGVQKMLRDEAEMAAEFVDITSQDSVQFIAQVKKEIV